MNKIESSPQSPFQENSIPASNLLQNTEVHSFQGTPIQLSETSTQLGVSQKKGIENINHFLGKQVELKPGLIRSASEPILPSQTQPKVKIEDLSILNPDTPLNADEIEGLVWMQNGIETFAKSYQALDAFRQKDPSQSGEQIDQHYFYYDPQEKIAISSKPPIEPLIIEQIKKRFISAAEQFYGKEVLGYALSEEEQNKLLGQNAAPLRLEEVHRVLAKADSIIEEARNYLQACPKLSADLARAVALHLPLQEALTRAEEAYQHLSTPAQHLLRGTYYSIESLAQKIFFGMGVVAGAGIVGTISAGIGACTCSGMMAFCIIDPIMVVHIGQAVLSGHLTSAIAPALGMVTGLVAGAATARSPITTLMGGGIGGLTCGTIAGLSLSAYTFVITPTLWAGAAGALVAGIYGGIRGGLDTGEAIEPYFDLETAAEKVTEEWDQVKASRKEQQEALTALQKQQEQVKEVEQKFHQTFEFVEKCAETLLSRNTPLNIKNSKIIHQRAEALTDLLLLHGKMTEVIEEKKQAMEKEEQLKAAKEKRLNERIDQRARLPRGI